MNVERTLEKAMTVADLIAELQGLAQDAAVLFVTDYGDYGHTQQALPLQSVDMGDGKLVESAYSRSDVAYEKGDTENSGAYCGACDREWNGKFSRCPKCNGQCVDEAGHDIEDGADEDDPATFVILQF